MPRIRSIKPEFWTSEQLGRCSMLARLSFAGLIGLADDKGRGRGDARYLFGQLHAYSPDVDLQAFVRALSELAARPEDTVQRPLAVFYRVAGATYYWLPGFLGPNGQKIDKPSDSKLPPPPENVEIQGELLNLSDDSSSPRELSPSVRRGLLPEGKGEEGRGVDGKGRDGIENDRGDGAPTDPQERAQKAGEVIAAAAAAVKTVTDKPEGEATGDGDWGGYRLPRNMGSYGWMHIESLSAKDCRFILDTMRPGKKVVEALNWRIKQAESERAR